MSERWAHLRMKPAELHWVRQRMAEIVMPSPGMAPYHVYMTDKQQLVSDWPCGQACKEGLQYSFRTEGATRTDGVRGIAVLCNELIIDTVWNDQLVRSGRQ